MSAMKLDDLKKLSTHECDSSCSYIKVGLSSCGIAAGAQEIFDFLSDEVKKRAMPVTVRRCGCSGMCYAEPLVEVCIDGVPAVTYGRVTQEVAVRILEEHIRDHRLVNDHIVEMLARRQV